MAAERMHVFLLLRRGGKPERAVVWDTQDITVGRDPANDVVLSDPEMSRNHARFHKDGGSFRVDNLSTSNATCVNGEAITSQVLESKDVVRIAEVELVFYRVPENPVTLGIQTEYASQLKGFGPKGVGDGEATVLGLMDTIPSQDDFRVQPAGDFDHELAGMNGPPLPRNLDAELAGDLDELDIPARAAARPAPAAWSLDDGAPEAGTLSFTVELEGLSAEQRQVVQGLLGKVLVLPQLRIRLKSDDLG